MPEIIVGTKNNGLKLKQMLSTMFFLKKGVQEDTFFNYKIFLWSLHT